MLKALSIIGYAGMVAGIIALFATKNLFSPSAVVIAVQVGAALLVLWARLTFGRRSFHLVANPTSLKVVHCAVTIQVENPSNHLFYRMPLNIACSLKTSWTEIMVKLCTNLGVM